MASLSGGGGGSFCKVARFDAHIVCQIFWKKHLGESVSVEERHGGQLYLLRGETAPVCHGLGE